MQRTRTIFSNTKSIIKEDISSSNSNLDLELDLNSNNTTLDIKEDKVYKEGDVLEEDEDIILEDIEEDNNSITY